MSLPSDERKAPTCAGASASGRWRPEVKCRVSPSRHSFAEIRAAMEAAEVMFIPENGSGAGVRLAKR